MIAEKEMELTVKIEEGEMERIFEVAELLKKIEDEIYGESAYETKIKTLVIVEEPTGNTLSVASTKMAFDDFVDMNYTFCKFFDI